MSSNTLLRPNGINHLALSTSDIKGVLQYFNDVLGMPLAALYWMHGVENTVHGFLELNESSLLAFVFSPKISADVEIGKTHSGNPGDPCVGGTMQHLALNVDSLENLLAIRDRIRSRNIHCFGPMDHGMMQSIYFAGPDGMTLEVATLTGEDFNKWIDPEVVEMLGLTTEELDRLQNPQAYERPAEPVKNVPLEQASEYRMVYPEDYYATILGMSDEEFTEATRDSVPPTASRPGQ